MEYHRAATALEGDGALKNDVSLSPQHQQIFNPHHPHGFAADKDAAAAAAFLAADAAGPAHPGPAQDGWAWPPQDAMDLDYDSEIAAWIGSWGGPASDVPPPMPVHLGAAAAMDGICTALDDRIEPDDFLFPDDEVGGQPQNHPGVSGDMSVFHPEPPPPPPPTTTKTLLEPDTKGKGLAIFHSPHPPDMARTFTPGKPPPGPPYELNLNDPETLKFYDDVLLLSRKGSCGEKLEFDDCGDSREAILHLLAMRFKLDYSYNPITRKASMRRPASPVNSIMSRSQQSITIICPTGPDDDDDDEGDDGMTEKATVAAAAAAAAATVIPKERLGVLRKTSLKSRNGSLSSLSSSTPTPPTAGPPPSSSSSSITAAESSLSVRNKLAASTTKFSLLAADKDQQPHQLLRQTFLDNPVNHPLSHRISSWSIFHSGIASRRPRGRRGPLSEKSRSEIKVLEGVGGACWRCRILRRKCDPGDPCKSCPAPHLREDAPPWPLIGCRRGSLQEAMPPQILCPMMLRRGGPGSCETILETPMDPSPACRSQPDMVAKCFREAEMQRLSDNKLVLESAAVYLRTRGDSPAASHFSQAIRAGRYRANASLGETCRAHDKIFTYAELISSIAWELTDIRDVSNVLEIESVECFMLLLETASMYEADVGKTSMVGLAIVCLRCCLDGLRLCAANLLTPQIHGTCKPDLCSIDCLRDLCSHIYSYIDELSVMMFKKMNLRDRRWWLSTFYSLCIQSYVRRGLLVLEQHLTFGASDDSDLNSAQYLHLITVLFIAVSFQYDPLSSGRLQNTLSDDGVAPEAMVPELYLVSARTVCGVEAWPNEGIKSSYQFLTRMFNIGSLDFADVPVDLEMTDSPAAVTTTTSAPLSPKTPGMWPDPAAATSPAIMPELVGGKMSGTTPRDARSPAAVSRDSMYSMTTNSSHASLGSLGSSMMSQSTGITSPRIGPTSPRSSFSAHRISVGSIASRLSGISALSASGGFEAAAQAAWAVSTEQQQQPGRLLPPPHRKPQQLQAMSNMSGTSFVCSCCPKRPQTFQTHEDLKAHEAKKPHICAFCGRRFSRMNEAERHINTIHLRPYSWSCGKLESPLQAFQCVTSGSDIFDVCGFCGHEFKRSSGDEPLADEDTERLVLHLQTQHKVGECNTAKKFFREDLFGQHLKSSHAAEPGVWMKCLENACKTDENPTG